MTGPLGDDLMKLELLSGLAAKLQSVPDAMLLAVVEQLGPLAGVPEVIRLFDALRPRLRELRPPRPLSLKRLLCRPFEDLLTSEPVAEEEGVRPVHIPRTAIAPCWEFLSGAASAELATLDRRLRSLTLAEPERVLDLGESLWSLAANLLIDQAPSSLPSLIGETLAAAGQIERFKAEVPSKPFAALRDEEWAAVIGLVRELLGGGLPVTGFLLVIAARAQSPSGLIELMRRDGFGVPTELDSFAVAQLVERAAGFEHRIATARPEVLAREADTMLSELTEMRKSLGAGGCGLDRHGSGIEAAVRTALGTRVIDPAPQALEAAFELDPSADSLRNAEAHARALRHSRRAAAAVGLGEQAQATISAMQSRFAATIDEELKRAGDAAGRPAPGGVVAASVYRAIRMIELLAGPEAARPHLMAAMSKTAPHR